VSAGISSTEFKLLRDYIEERCGIALGEEKAYLIETRLTKLMALNGCDDFTQFHRLIKSSNDAALHDKIIDAMTTNETLWFRDTHPFVILREKILPELVKELRAGKKQKVRIWSAASSTGQEAYSIAMTIHEYCRVTPGIRPEQFEIVGTDISSSALFLAKNARYDAIAIKRGLSDELRDRYFHVDGRIWVVNDSVKNMATFQKFNLQDSPSALGRFDIIFLRYVAIYFSLNFKQALFKNLARAANRPGHLIIGAVESLRGVSEEFEMKSHGGGYYYTI
jgi:chemotaxis protein methyltransferase CheR